MLLPALAGASFPELGQLSAIGAAIPQKNGDKKSNTLHFAAIMSGFLSYIFINSINIILRLMGVKYGEYLKVKIVIIMGRWQQEKN